jgi:hypothetical protein
MIGLRASVLPCALAIAVSAQAQRVVEAPNLRPSSDGLPQRVVLWQAGGRTADPLELQFSEILAIAADTSGRVFIADWASRDVRIFSRTGTFVRLLGPTGSGPGEFRTPMAISVAPDGAVFVLDVGLSRVSEFDAALRFVRTVSISPPIRNPTRIAVSRDRIFITGALPSRSLTASIHAFSRRDGAYLRSFGSFPPAPTLEHSYLVGAGTISLSSDGGVWHAQVAPYRVRKFSADGEMLVDIRRENDFLPPADTAIAITIEGTTRTTSHRPHAGAFNVREIAGGLLVVQVRVPALGASVTDVFDATFTLRHSWLGAPSMTAPVGQSDRYAIIGASADGVPWIGVTSFSINR